MPSWHRYELQDEAYKESVMPGAVKARVAIEMAGEFGWSRYVGNEGRIIAMTTFGASAPLAKLQDKYGFTAENIVKVAREAMAS